MGYRAGQHMPFAPKLLRFFSRRVSIALGVALMLPSLALGYFADDWILLHDLHAGGGGMTAATRLYRFSLGWIPRSNEPRGFLPWWLPRDYHTDFLRPLSGISFWIDERLWPGGGVPAHLHSLFWWALVLLAVSALFRRWLPAPVAALALLIVAVDDGHWMPVAWLANRHAAITAAAVFGGIWAHLRWRDDGWRAGLPLSLAAFAFGLGAGESSLQALAYLYTDELFGSGRARGRFARLVPVTLMIVVYAALRHSLGASIRGSGIYIDPAAHPLGFLMALPPRLAVLLGDLLGGMSSDLWFAMPKTHPLLIAVGSGVIALVGWLTVRVMRELPDGEARALRGLLLGSLAGLSLGAAGLPGSRLLLAPSVGAAALIATILLKLPGMRLARGWLFTVHLVLAPLALLFDQGQAIRVAHLARSFIAASDVTGDVIVVTTPDAFVSIYSTYLEKSTEKPARFTSWRVLAFAPLDVTLTRVAPDELRLTTDNGQFLQSPQERLMRDTPLVPGEEVAQEGMVAHVESLSSVRFRFVQPLEQLHFVAWRDGALRTVALPKLGESVTLRREPGLLGF